MSKKQLELKGTIGRGGKRKGAGRKNRSGTVNHMARPRVSAHFPMHVTMRLASGRPSMRRQVFLKVFAKAAELAQKFGLRIIHFAIMGNHIHLIVEADSNAKLGRGIQSLSIRLAKSLKRIASEKILGPVFNGRYHMKILSSPYQTKNAIRYVLTNEFKHKKQAPKLTVFSSGGVFRDWGNFDIRYCAKDRVNYTKFWRETGALETFLSRPKSWLAAEGWKLA